MAAQDLLTVTEAKPFLGKVSGADDAALGLIISRASDWLEAMTNRKLAERAYSNLRLTGPVSTKLYVPAWPINVVATLTVSLDTASQTTWKAEADGDPVEKDVVVASDDPWDSRFGLRNHLYRASGWQSASSWGWPTRSGSDQYGQHTLLLSYTGGYKLTQTIVNGVVTDGSEAIPQDLKQACLYLVQKLWRDQDKQRTGIVVASLPTGGSISLDEPWLPREVKHLIAPYCRLVFSGV